MPRAIAIDTSGREGSIVAVRDGVIGPEQLFPHGLQHAAGLIVLIDGVAREQGWQPRDIEQLYLSIGPGSFTGLRIAVTAAKMMALAGGVRIVTVPTPRSLAENAPADAAHVITVADAKRGQIFTARYEQAGGVWREVEPPHLDDLSSMLARAPRPVHLVGEGIAYHAKSIPDDPRIILTPKDAWRSRATTIAKLAADSAARGDFVDADMLTPAYIRRAEAEEKWDAQHAAR